LDVRNFHLSVHFNNTNFNYYRCIGNNITTASSGGSISSDGGATVTARGIAWSTNNNPTIDLSIKTVDGSGTGIFTSDISGLAAGTTYYVRAYATNSFELLWKSNHI
jgi:hypothetical protein